MSRDQSYISYVRVGPGGSGDAMYGEALLTALAVHVLREYGGIAVGLQHAHGAL